MAENDKIESMEDPSLSNSTLSNLRGRQSVRATFKLTDSCIEAIGIIAAQMGIKQKSLFDHLFNDTRSLSAIAQKVRNARLQAANRIQKTFVISRGALVSLEEIARSFNAPRDALIEISIQQLLPMIADQRKRHAKRKAIFERIEKHLAAGRKMLAEAYAELGEEDLITDRLNAAMANYESGFKHMSAFIEKSEGIETFEPEEFTKIDIVFEDE
jgi:predicted acylesterase/phospholipase RssA